MTLQNLERDDTASALDMHHHDLAWNAEARPILRFVIVIS